MATEKVKALKLHIDISDWRDELQRQEASLHNEDDIVTLVVDEGLSTGEVARMAVAARAMKMANPDILASDKLLVYAGAREGISQIMAGRRITVELESGEILDVREFVGISGGPEMKKDRDEEPSERESILGDKPFVSAESELGLARACHYLRDVIPGHIYERLKVIKVSGGDTLAIAEELKAKIDELVGRLSDPIVA